MCSLNALGISNSSHAQVFSPRAQNTGNSNVTKNIQSSTSLPNCSSTNLFGSSSTQSKSAIQNDNQATSIGQNPDSMTQSSETRLDEACKTLNEITSQETKLQEVSPDHAKAVEATNELIIEILKTIMEKKRLSAEEIKNSILSTKGVHDYSTETDPCSAEETAFLKGSPTAEIYDPYLHGGAYGEKAEPSLLDKYKRKSVNEQIPTALRGNPPFKQDEASMKKLRNGYNFSTEPPIEFKNNEWPDEIKILMSKLDHQEKKDSSEPTEEIEALKDKIYKSKLEHLKSNIKDDFHLFEIYSSQLIREYTSYSGEIKIEKLKPGTVLVRDFGQGQSVKSSCWCLASDVDSAVTCDKDLQTKLAVLPSWNGGGNRAVFIVPNEPPPIYVAVGKIAQQKNESDYETTVYHEGGGTQYNILTPNIPGEITENSGGFANAGKAFDKCCIVIVNNGIITSKDRTLITPDVTLQTSYSVANTEIHRK